MRAPRAREVVDEPVGIDGEDDPDLAGVDDVRDLGIDAVVVGQEMEQVQRLLDRQVLAGVVQCVEEDLGLALIDGHVVADLRRPDIATLVALADAEDMDDVRVRDLGRLDVGDHLGVAVVARIFRRKVGRSDGCRGECEQDQSEYQLEV